MKLIITSPFCNPAGCDIYANLLDLIVKRILVITSVSLCGEVDGDSGSDRAVWASKKKKKKQSRKVTYLAKAELDALLAIVTVDAKPKKRHAAFSSFPALCILPSPCRRWRQNTAEG